MNWDAMQAVGQIGGALAAAAAIWWGLRGVRRQMWLSTFTDFTGRYAEIIERFPSDARRPGHHMDLTRLPLAERDPILAALRQYFNLCSEEHYLAGLKIIDKQTWGIWTTGIKDSFRNTVFTQGWEQLRIEYEYYPAFLELMDKLVEIERQRLRRGA